MVKLLSDLECKLGRCFIPKELVCPTIPVLRLMRIKWFRSSEDYLSRLFPMGISWLFSLQDCFWGFSVLGGVLIACVIPS